MNPCTENRSIAVRLKQRQTRIFYIYHEPSQFSLRYLKDEGLAATVKAVVAHRFTTPVLKVADTVILASNHGLNTYRNGDARFNSNAIYLPLLYDDVCPPGSAEFLAKKIYFSYIGNPCRAHGFDQFVAMMRYALGADKDVKFLIACRHPLPSGLLNDPLLIRNSDRARIQCGRLLSDEEVNIFYAESLCVWNAYRRSTQSGVLPKAFMFGTPVVSTRTGSFEEYVQDGYNGVFVPSGHPEHVLNAQHAMSQDLDRYFRNCRKTFLDTFFYRAHLQQLNGALASDCLQADV
jgi:glycosyltransferase involved in cell wall biosynthesis